MARPKSENKRKAILDAATRVIAAQGLGAPTAAIAKDAGISSGALFTYFSTKAELYNQLYLELKTGIAAAALKNFPERGDLRAQVFHAWSNWMHHAAKYPEQRRVMAMLAVCEDITPETREAVYKNMGRLIALLEGARTRGPMAEAPANISGAIIQAIFEATMDTMIADPAHARKHCEAGFDALWRAIGPLQ